MATHKIIYCARPLNASSSIALDFHFHMAMRGIFSIGVHATGGRFVQVIFATVFANFGGNIANDYHRVVSLQRNGGGAGVSMRQSAIRRRGTAPEMMLSTSFTINVRSLPFTVRILSGQGKVSLSSVPL